MFAGSIVKPGFNPLAAQTPSYTYYLYSWGRNNFGELGLGNTTYYSSPKQVGSLANWLKISGGYKACASIKTDGTLWTWGQGNYGQLGLGNTTNYSSPKQVGALTTWSTISMGTSLQAMSAIKTDGTLWTWGMNVVGVLGLGNTTYYSSPKQVGSLTNWSNGASANLCSYAIKTDGTLWSWGYNGSGGLGLGNLTNYSSPKQIGALTNWASVTASAGSFVIALKTNGTLWSWGTNNFGQLGLGDTTDRSSPVQIGSLATWANQTCGSGGVLAIKTDGTIWSWGRNGAGQLGLGNTTNYSSPTQIGSNTSWYLTAFGTENSYGLSY